MEPGAISVSGSFSEATRMGCGARRSAPTASASSLRLGTRRRGCGTAKPASRSVSRSKATRIRCERGVQPATASASSPRLTDKTARLWDGETGKPIGEPLKGHGDAVWSAAFSPDGKRIVTASDDKTARLWDGETGKPIGEPLKATRMRCGARRSAPTASASSPRLGQDGAAVGRRNRQAHRRAAQRPRGSVWSAAFSPDGKRIVTASGDKTARLWDGETGKPIGDRSKATRIRCGARRSAPTASASSPRLGQDGAAVGRRDRQAHRRAAQRP